MSIVCRVFGSRLRDGLRLAVCPEILDHPLIFVACFTQLPDVLLGDVLVAVRGSFEQLKAGRLAVLELPFATLFLSLKILDKVHDNRPATRFDFLYC